MFLIHCCVSVSCMKYAMFGKSVFVLLSLSIGLNAFLIDHTLDHILLGIAAKFRSKCASIGGPRAFSELQAAINDLNNCVPIQFKEPDTICTDQRKKSYDCYENFFSKLEMCLYPQEVYIKDLILYAHNSTFDNNCKDEGNELLVKRNKFQRSPCHTHSLEIFSAFVENCAQELSIVRNLYKRDDVITKTDLCQDINQLSNCKFDVGKICEDYDDFKNFLEIVFSSYREACNHLMAAENTSKSTKELYSYQ